GPRPARRAPRARARTAGRCGGRHRGGRRSRARSSAGGSGEARAARAGARSARPSLQSRRNSGRFPPWSAPRLAASDKEADMVVRAPERSSAQDFDFWMGSWTVHGRRLRKRLAGCEEWLELEGTATAWPLLDGLGNVDEFRTDFDGGFSGMSLRVFDP